MMLMAISAPCAHACTIILAIGALATMIVCEGVISKDTASSHMRS